MQTRSHLVLLCLATLLPAQEQAPPDLTPAKELERFAPMLGTFKGKGTMRMSPDGPAAPWSAVVRYQKVLGGHFIREDHRIILPKEAGMPDIVMRGWLGWNKERRRYEVAYFGNDGRAKHAQTHLTGPTQTVTTGVNIENGMMITERWVMDFGKQGFKLAGYRAPGGAESFRYIEGNYTRDQEIDPKLFEVLEGSAMGPAPEEMGRVAKMAGKYTFAGEMVPMPGMPAMKISGKESIRMLYGGSIGYFEVHGDPQGGMTYEAHMAMSWDPVDRCYVTVHVNNMGEIGTGKAWFRGDKMVTHLADMRYGDPILAQHIIEFDAKGGLKRIVGHDMWGGRKPAKSFVGEYERK